MVFSRFPSLLSACLFVSLPAAGQLAKPIPPLHGTLLTGAAVDLPRDLHGASAVLVIGFSQGSRPQVADWGKRLTVEYAGTPQVRWFEVAELESVPRLLRGWVAKKVREGVSARGQATFLIVNDHEQEWKQTVGFQAADEAYVVVVDGTGVVRGVAHGAASEASLVQVKAAVQQAQLRR